MVTKGLSKIETTLKEVLIAKSKAEENSGLAFLQ